MGDKHDDPAEYGRVAAAAVAHTFGWKEASRTCTLPGPAPILDSGARRVFKSGAHRDRVEGKGAFNLLPYQGLLEVAQVFEKGGKKYTNNNWRLGMPCSEYVNSGIRHALKCAQGWDDENHAAMAAWNFMCLIETRHMVKMEQLPQELDDIDNWFSKDGVVEAMRNVQKENEARLAALAKEKQT